LVVVDLGQNLLGPVKVDRAVCKQNHVGAEYGPAKDVVEVGEKMI